MKCIFCKKDSSDSKSIEHIIPESLCEDHHTLPIGVVCDLCNNYFSRKIEKPVLESDEFKYLRFHQGIKSKKGKFPRVKALYNNKPIELSRENHKDKNILIVEDNKSYEHAISNKGQLLIPVTGQSPSEHKLGRFIAKMAVEFLAKRVMHIENWNEDFINNNGLNAIVQFVRFPKRNEIWEYTKRKVYDKNSKYIDGNKVYQTLNEMDLVVTNYKRKGKNVELEVFFVIIIFGIEYAINISGDCMLNYKSYLRDNNYISPLYSGSYADDADKRKDLVNTEIS